MHYYTVHLPLNLDKELVYSSCSELQEGVRVVVSVGAKHHLGICGIEALPEHKSSIRYKQIEEVLDTEPLLPAELLKLGMWMASYYRCPIGKVLFAMLPSRLQPEPEAYLKWISDAVPPEFAPLHDALQDRELSLKDLRPLLPGYALYRRTEEAEALGLINIKRKLKHKDKPKTANYIVRQTPSLLPDSLPLKQREAWELICNESGSFPLANLSATVAYSAIKALVKKGFISIQARQVNPLVAEYDAQTAPKQITLNDAQNQAIAEVAAGFGSFGVHLLYGITGSGKTEIYIAMMRKYLENARSIIFLIPEIALTPQMVERFRGCFGDTLAIQHSQLSELERLQQWKSLRQGEKRIVVGARSAIFAPIPDLGLIIVDEEHEGTYKQDNLPRYHGRDMAILRGQMQNAQVIIGSATPALESWYNAQTGKYKLHKLESRPLDYQLPKVQIVDMREQSEPDLISPTLVAAIDERLQKQEQVILFQNRRGFSSFLQCLKCGNLIKCKQCDISMTYHRDREEMHCHYCGSFFPSPRKCPDCGSYSFSYGAPGTQKVEQLLKILFPTARIMRMDSDSARSKDTYGSMYKRMKSREVDILLGTQMISKGLDFPFVTLVGIVMADISLNVPDFRAAERTFQLITQVAGRSGRNILAGEVIIQTFNAEHYAIQAASLQDYDSFATLEMQYRKQLFYPPYCRLARILWQSMDRSLLTNQDKQLELIKTKLGAEHSSEELVIIGPTEAPLAKVGNLFRHHLIIKAINSKVLREALNIFGEMYNPPSGVRQSIDVDPMYLM